MIVKLLTEHHLDFLGLKGGCRGSSESTDVKMLHCWKSRALAHLFSIKLCIRILMYTSNTENKATILRCNLLKIHILVLVFSHNSRNCTQYVTHAIILYIS